MSKEVGKDSYPNRQESFIFFLDFFREMSTNSFLDLRDVL